jgi:hypothetical protein
MGPGTATFNEIFERLKKSGPDPLSFPSIKSVEVEVNLRNCPPSRSADA